jgi:hypothetical protein
MGERARELLAAELEAEGFHLEAELVRNPTDGALHLPFLRAIEKALALSTLPRTYGDGIEDAARVAEREPHDGEPSSRPYRREVGKGIAAAIRTLSPSGIEDVREAAGWQPIETAPKDGTEIVCLDEIYGKRWRYAAVWNGIQWYTGFGDSWPNARPTHWMPLPDPPLSASSKIGGGNG